MTTFNQVTDRRRQDEFVAFEEVTLFGEAPE
jgi:hypothetical protein